MISFYLSESIENCKMSGKIREKSGNFEGDDNWQPCYSFLTKSAVCDGQRTVRQAILYADRSCLIEKYDIFTY